MNDLQVFKFENEEVRVVMKNGEPWFVAKDVCDILGLDQPGNSMRNFPDNEKGMYTIHTLGGKQEMLIVNEPGLYRLVFQSRKPEAEAFKTLVFTEVLPTIRKTGTYTVPGREEKPLKEPSAAKIKEIRMAHSKGVVTVNEYRQKAFNLPPFEIDAPLEVPNPGKRTTAPPVEKIRPSDELIKFVDENIEFTGNSENFIRLSDAYERYARQVEKPLSRFTFTYTLRGSFNLLCRQKKLGGYPTSVFLGCKFKTGDQ